MTFKVLDFDVEKEFWNNRIKTHDLKLDRGEKRKGGRKKEWKKAEVLRKRKSERKKRKF